MDYISYYNSPLGRITLSSDGDALTGLWFYGQKYYAAGLSAERKEQELYIFRETRKWLDIYFGGKCPGFTPDVKLKVSPFRELVYEVLQEIPFGSTVTYGDIAESIAKRTGVEKMSAQAVGAAVGRNPISIIIPCHRVLGAKGKLTGYAGGLDRKLWLLSHERAIMR